MKSPREEVYMRNQPKDHGRGRSSSGISEVMKSSHDHWTLWHGRDTKRHQPDRWAKVSKKKKKREQRVLLTIQLYEGLNCNLQAVSPQGNSG